MRKPLVDSLSSDEEILNAIDTAGEKKLPWRDHDWPEPGENNSRCWVMAGDVGVSNVRNRSLLKRLKKMVRQGKLEMRRYSGRTVRIRLETERVKHYRGAPRFRVIRK